MKLVSLYLKNVRCYEEIYLDCIFYKGEKQTLRGRTIILGYNGTGKTTILKSIALILSGSNALGELLGNPNSWIMYSASSCVIQATVEFSDKEEKTFEIILQRDDSLADVVSRNLTSLNMVDDILRNEKTRFLSLGYGVRRTTIGVGFDNKTSIYNNKQAENVATLFNSQSVLYPFETWLLDVHYEEGKKGLDKIALLFNELIPDNAFHSIDKKKKKILFKNKDGIVEFNQLNDGFKIIANWLGDLLYRISKEFENLKNPLEAKFILLIDELGLHLHPSLQRTVMQRITNLFKNAQIVATTDSPFVAQQAGESELFTVIRDNDDVLNLFHYENDPRKLLIHQIIMSDIFGLATDESVFVEEAKNKLRKDPSLQDEAILKTGTEGLKNVEQLEDIPLNTYSYESAGFDEVIDKLKTEMKKIQDEKIN